MIVLIYGEPYHPDYFRFRGWKHLNALPTWTRVRIRGGWQAGRRSPIGSDAVRIACDSATLR